MIKEEWIKKETITQFCFYEMNVKTSNVFIFLTYLKFKIFYFARVTDSVVQMEGNFNNTLKDI